MAGDIVRIFIVDDNAGFLNAARALLEIQGECTVVGTALDAAGAMECLEQIIDEVDVVLVDVHLEQESGVDLCRSIVGRWPQATVLLVSTLREDDLPADTTNCGAVGFLSKLALSPTSVIGLVRMGDHGLSRDDRRR